MSTTIRPATPDDANAIASIHVASWKSTYRGMLDGAVLEALTPDHRLGMWERLLGSDPLNVAVFVAEQDGEIAGFASYGPQSSAAKSDPSLEFYTIYLRPAMERQGIGSLLILALEEGMIHSGAMSACLWVHRDNASARRFYEAHQWQRSGGDRTVTLWEVQVHEVQYCKALSSNNFD
jgi:GNAT superfamily N-acetyltransferase